MYNRFPFDDVLLDCEQEAGEVVLSEHGVGRRHDIAGMLSNDGSDILEPEGMMGSVSTALEVYAWSEEEEEGDSGEIADGNVSSVGSLGGDVQGLDNHDREGELFQPQMGQFT